MSRTFGEIITFYSYKGGTGRSMVLANVGYLLSASREYGRKRVLLIDWDLEAPGLERFFTGNNKPDGLGLIDYLTDMAELYGNQAPGARLPESMARHPEAIAIFKEGIRKYPLRRYVTYIEGDLHLMHAGHRSIGGTAREDEYWEKVREFNWDAFYRNYGSFFTHFREMLMNQYDYVLIDSRTGLTDIGGICTRVMPEKLVLIFAPNHQNIEGVSRVALKSISYRKASRDPRSLTIFPVASRIDASASTLRNVWWRGGEVRGEQIRGYQETFEQLVREAYRLDRCDLRDYFDATQVPHDSDYAYGEAIAAAIDGTHDRFGIGYACDQLARRLVEQTAPWEAPGEHQGSVIISYRRADSAGAAVRLYRDLSEWLGLDHVILDLASMRASAADPQVDNAMAVLVLIGEDWLKSEPTARPSRLGRADDIVYDEIAGALERDLLVIPVLLDDVEMPTRAQLPPAIQLLADRRPISLRSSSWDNDVYRLASILMPIIGLEPTEDSDTYPPARTEPGTAAQGTVRARIADWFRSLSS
jgi:cellulose biosynthesis protein BcsQ